MAYVPTRIYGPAQPVTMQAAPAAPTLAASGTGTTVTATAKYLVLTFVNARGETVAGAQATITPAAGNTITVTVPAFPSGVTSARVYEGTANGGPYYLQGTVSASAGSLSITTEPNTGNTTPPTANGLTISGPITPSPALTTGSVLKEISLTNSFLNGGVGGLELTLNGVPILSLYPINQGQTIIVPFSKVLQASDALAVLQQNATNLIALDISVEKV